MSTGQQFAYTTDSSDEFVDDPLEPVTQDNIDVELRIGPAYMFERGSVEATDRPVVRPTEQARSYEILEAEVELVDGPETNYMTATVVGDGHDVVPSEGDPLDRNEPPDVITLDIDNELTESERGGGEITRVFTGVIANASRLGNGQYEFVAFWPGFNEIQNEDIIVAPPPALFFNAGTVNYNPRRQKVSQLVRRVGISLTFDNIFDYRINVAQTGIEVGDRPNGQTFYSGFDPEVTVDSWRAPIKELLTQLELKSESVWEVDRYGDFYFGAIQPEAHKLRYITDSSAGKMSPAWRSVRVIGDGVVSEDGWGSSAMINEDPERVQGNIADDELDDELAEPTFVYRNMEINTEDEARHVMNELREEIRDQAAGGEVEVIGHPEVWPGDAIELPDAPNQPFGLERFGVKKVIHRLNSSDGFMTKIKCGGLTNGKQTTFEDTLNELIIEDRIAEIVAELRRRGFTNIADLLEQERYDELVELFRANSLNELSRAAVEEKWLKMLNILASSDLSPEDIDPDADPADPDS